MAAKKQVEDKRKGWLKELKVGDKVVISNTYREDIHTVDNITPSGQMDVSKKRFDQSGYFGSGWSKDRLQEWTQETENKINNGRLAGRIENNLHETLRRADGLYEKGQRLKALDTEKLREIDAFFQEWADQFKGK